MNTTPASAKWSKITQDKDGNTIFNNFDRVREHNGFVYYWTMISLKKVDPTEWRAVRSILNYDQGDCDIFRSKRLSHSALSEPNGFGSTVFEYSKPLGWKYPKPHSVEEIVLKSVYDR